MGVVLNLVGVAVLIAFLWLISADRKAIEWKLVAKGLIAQLVLALIVVKTPVGIYVIEKIGEGINLFLDQGRAGLTFVFGNLMNAGDYGFIFILHALGNIIFVAAFVSILNYLGVLPYIIKAIGKLVGKVMGTPAIDNFISVANVFMGSESVLLIGGYLKYLSKPSLMVVVVSTIASMSSAILAGYVAIGAKIEYLLIAASLIPFGSLVVAHLVFPSREHVDAIDTIEIDRKQSGSNILDAMGNGASDGMKLVLAISATLIAMISLVSLIDLVLSPLSISLREIMGYIFYPIAFLLGLDQSATVLAAQILGEKLVINEFIAFDTMINAAGQLTTHDLMVLTVTVAGFSNLGTMAQIISVIGTLCPEQKATVAQLVLRGLAAAFSLNLINGMLVGIFA